MYGDVCYLKQSTPRAIPLKQTWQYHSGIAVYKNGNRKNTLPQQATM